MTIYPLRGRPPYSTNCYLAVGEEPGPNGLLTAVLVDAEVTPQQVRAQLEQCRASLCAILLTHGHFDHVGNLGPLRTEFGAAVWMSEQDSAFFHLDADHFYSGPVEIGDLRFTPIATPGHTPGSVCLACGEVLFSGDTLFAGSVGRTDLKGGDPDALWRSLALLNRTVRNDPQVLPGHGEFSTFEEERSQNPYLRNLG